MNLQHSFDTFITKFMKNDPEFLYVAFAFLGACMFWACPILFSRNDVLGKLVMVAGIIAMTMYHRIAGIVALILVIASLNRTPSKMEGLSMPNGEDDASADASANPLLPSPTPAAAISFKSPSEFRQKYCLKGIGDDPSHKIEFGYMLSPTLFGLDASGNPTITEATMKSLGAMDRDSFIKCTPMTYANGAVGHDSINNMCDPKCEWTMKPAPTTAPTTGPTTAPTTMPTEGFSTMAMLRPHIRNGRRLMSDGAANVKAAANRLKRKLF